MRDDVHNIPPATGLLDGVETYERDGITLRRPRWYQDYNSFTDVRAYAPLDVREGDTVLDLGANIGCYPLRVALPAGAARVVCVEPEPSNFALLAHNVREHRDRVELRNVGVSALGGPIPLFLSTRSGMGHSTFVRAGRRPILMETVTLESLLDELRPRVVKVDVEGAEYELGLDRLPDYVEAFGVEFHFLGKPLWLNAIRELVPRIEASGFRPLRPVNVSGSNWNPVTMFIRQREVG